MKKFFTAYRNDLIELLNSLNLETLEKVVNLIESMNNTSHKIYVLGNGGSAATASHMENDLGIGLKRRDIRNFQIESLADNTSVVTAIANDIGYDNIFYAQLKDKVTKDDLIIAISCSGNSPNIIKAVEYCRSQGTKIISFTGFDGGKLKSLSDLNLHVSTSKGKYGIVEDVHMIFDHIIYSYFIETSNNDT